MHPKRVLFHIIFYDANISIFFFTTTFFCFFMISTPQGRRGNPRTHWRIYRGTMAGSRKTDGHTKDMPSPTVVGLGTVLIRCWYGIGTVLVRYWDMELLEKVSSCPLRLFERFFENKLIKNTLIINIEKGHCIEKGRWTLGHLMVGSAEAKKSPPHNKTPSSSL